jgi:hypothetical protein
MKGRLNKGVFQDDVKLFKFSKLKFVVGILLGLSYAFSFYGLMYMTREVFRYFTITPDYDLMVLTSEEYSFYNFVFAFIAVIYGQSVCFVYWFNGPKKPKEKNYRRRLTIVNDQRLYFMFFLFWFSSLAIDFSIYLVIFKKSYYTFSFYPNYIYLFILFLLVLFLLNWNRILRTYKGKAFRWQLLTLIVVLFLSFGLSKINFINHEKHNKRVLSKSIQHNYKFDLPESKVYYNQFHRAWNVRNIYLVLNKDPLIDNKPILVINNEEIERKNLCQFINNNCLPTYYGNAYDRMKLRLNIHSTMPMKEVFEIDKELSSCGFHNIDYAVIPENTEYDKRYYSLSFLSFISSFAI